MELTQRYWIISGREAIRSWEKECAWCRRRRSKPSLQIMVALPECRLKQSLRAFCHVSIDFGGPFITRQGRGKSRTKRYLCLFTCLATRAVDSDSRLETRTRSGLEKFAGLGLGLGLDSNFYRVHRVRSTEEWQSIFSPFARENIMK